MKPTVPDVAEQPALGDVGAAVSRRTALRRLAMLGIGVTAAGATLAGCGERTSAATSVSPRVEPPSPDGELGPPRAYNWTESNTRRLRASLDGAATRRANHVFIGDSITAGYLGAAENPPYDALVAWPRIYRSSLHARGTPVAGTGLVPCVSGDAPFDPRWTRSGGWNAGLAYTLFATASGETATFVSDTPGTEVSVYYFGNSSGLTVDVDGGGRTQLPVDGVDHAMVYTVSDLPDGRHTVVVTTTTDSYNQVVGASVQGGNGLVCHNISVAGATAAGPHLACWSTMAPGFVNATLVGALTAASITPDVVYVALGGDDILAGHGTSQIIAGLKALRTQFRSSDFVLIGENQFNGYQAVWGRWLRALYALAHHLDCPLVDLYDRYGEYGDAVASQLMGDGAHLNAKAQVDIGRMMAALACSPQ